MNCWNSDVGESDLFGILFNGVFRLQCHGKLENGLKCAQLKELKHRCKLLNVDER